MKIVGFFTDLCDWRSLVDSKFEKSKSGFFKSVFKYLNSDSNKFDIILTILILLVHIPIYYETIKTFLNWTLPHHNYFAFPLTAWLNTFEGGFVRRGLSGEFIGLLTNIFNLLPHITVAIITLSVFIVLVIWTVQICGKKIPIYFFFSPVMFALSARYDIIFSQDYFILLMYLMCIRIILSNINNANKYILVNIICIITILMHEIYFFVCLPLIILIYNFNTYKKIYSINCIFYFALPGVAMLTVAFYSGYTEEVSVRITEFWNEIYQKNIPDFCCMKSGVYFTFLFVPWMDVQFPRLVEFWKAFQYGFIWLPLIWLFLWYFCGLIIAKIIQHYDPCKEKLFLGFYYFSTFCSLPLYILASDYGRWILSVAIASFLATYSFKSTVNLPKILSRLRIITWRGPLRNWQKILVVFCFGIPTEWYNFGSYYYATPLWYPLHFIIDVHELFLLGII